MERLEIRMALCVKVAGDIWAIDIRRLPLAQKEFSLGILTGAFDSKVLPTRQWGIAAPRKLGEGACLLIHNPLKALGKAVLVILVKRELQYGIQCVCATH